jgi:hypothetical protein
MNNNSSSKDSITFIISVNDEDVFKNNFLSSPIFNGHHSHQIIIQRGFRSAALAYNSAMERAENDLLAFVHQDVFLPESWMPILKQSLSYLDKKKIKWGVLGCFGSRRGGIGGIGRVYTTGIGIHGCEIYKPEPVETLDEIVLVIRKSSGLCFDPSLPHFHLYGADICMSAREKGMPCYAIPAFCIHNTNQILILPKEFYECYQHVKKRWGKYLPIYTSCIKISRFDGEVHLRRIHKVYKRFMRKATIPVYRVGDPRTLLDNMLKAD